MCGTRLMSSSTKICPVIAARPVTLSSPRRTCTSCYIRSDMPRDTVNRKSPVASSINHNPPISTPITWSDCTNAVRAIVFAAQSNNALGIVERARDLGIPARSLSERSQPFKRLGNRPILRRYESDGRASRAAKNAAGQ